MFKKLCYGLAFFKHGIYFYAHIKSHMRKALKVIAWIVGIIVIIGNLGITWGSVLVPTAKSPP